MAENNYIMTAWQAYNRETREYELHYDRVMYLNILDILHMNKQDPWQKERFGEFIVHYIKSGDGMDTRSFVGASNTYIFYNGVKYDGEGGMEKLIMILKKESIEKLLEDM